MSKKLLLVCLPLLGFSIYYSLSAQFFSVVKNVVAGRSSEYENVPYIVFTWYQDSDGDGYGNPEVSITTTTDTAPDGYVSNNGDCVDDNPAINPTTVWYKDNDGDLYSDGTTVVGCSFNTGGDRYALAGDLLGLNGDCDDNQPLYNPATVWYRDADFDGYTSSATVIQCENPGIGNVYRLSPGIGTDCNDEDPNVHPDHEEICGNGIDDNCDGFTDDECAGDSDGDGTPDSEDCAPNDATKWRSAEMYKDNDHDGYYVSVGEICYGAELPEGYSLENFGTDDCDDNDSYVYVSYQFYVDNDGDGIGSSQTAEACVRFRENPPPGYSNETGDCDDNDYSVQYSFAFYMDADGDGYGATDGYSEVCATDGNTPPAGYALAGGDCDDANAAVHPGATEIIGNGIDDNCNGLIDEQGTLFTWYQDLDGDGFGNAGIVVYTTTNIAPDGYVSNRDDCDDTQASVNKAAIWYKDIDGDLYSNGDTVIRCYPPYGYRGLADYGSLSALKGFGDCNDSNGGIYPGALEICGNGIDDNCNGTVDEGCGDCGTPTSRLYVNAAVPVSGIGSGWNCAIKELSNALDIANSNTNITEIWVAKGTYTPTTSTDRTVALTITSNRLKILGGFAGNETQASQANPITNITTISGDIGVAGNMADNSYHLMRIPGLYSASAQTIDGFNFENANANGPNPNTEDYSYGGALVIYNAKTTNSGVIIGPQNTNLFIRRCLFKNNNASTAGGAVGINKFNQVYFDSCVFISNTSANGGALATHDSYLNITNSLFAHNKATTGSGGAIYNAGNYISLVKTTFDHNTASANGGAYFQQLPEAGAAAGLAYHKQCVFSNNTAARGGAIYQVNGVWVSNCTFFSNIASTTAGAMELSFTQNSNNIYAWNNIFWKNKKGNATNVSGADIIFSGSGIPDYSNRTIHNNIFQLNTNVPADNGISISDNLRGTDPMFVNETLPAGSDGFFGYLTDGLELKNTSPAKNIGNGGVGLQPTDILGKNRIACGQVDLGAYENQTCATLISKSDIIIKEGVRKSISANVTNPFSNSLLIRYSGAEKAEVDITTLTGQKVWKGSAIQKGQTQVNTSSWPSGLYQVTIRTASEKPIVFKVVKTQ